jgi:putative transposase
MLKTLRYRYRIYPTETQKVFLAQSFGSARFIYNHAIERIQKDYERGVKTFVSNVIADLPKTKQDTQWTWMNKVSSVLFQQSLRHLQTAYKNAFDSGRKQKMPTFKSKREAQSFTLARNAFHLDGKVLTIAKCDGPIKVVWSRDLPADPSSLTIIKNTSGQYFVSFVVKIDVSPLPSLDSIQALDLGIRAFATCSDGTVIPNPLFLERTEGKIRRLQRQYSRKYEDAKKKGKTTLVNGKEKVIQSRTMLRNQEKIRKLYLRLKNRREDFLKQLSSRLVHENQVIVLEDLNVKGMVKNSRLAKRIQTLGWGRFRQELQYQCDKMGRILVVVDRFFPSSKLCHDCGYKFTNLKAQKQWTCPVCGSVHDRDENAAANLKAEGLRILKTGWIPVGMSREEARS